MSYKTEQENFWAGKFGDDYIARNRSDRTLSIKIANWTKNLSRIGGGLSNCLELGPNIGLNFKALGLLFPTLQMTGVEINHQAAEECAKLDRVKVIEESILSFETDERFDLTISSGLLIHINPDDLPTVYDKLYNYSRGYIAISEYYNPTPVEVVYRGNTGKLFKRDFAGEMMDRFSDLELVDYGFFYHGDKAFPGGDSNWFLMRKPARRNAVSKR